MAETFNPGDVVQLKSKIGPRLVVTRAQQSDGIPHCECFWFNKSESQTFEVKSTFIPTAALERYLER